MSSRDLPVQTHAFCLRETLCHNMALLQIAGDLHSWPNKIQCREGSVQGACSSPWLLGTLPWATGLCPLRKELISRQRGEVEQGTLFPLLYCFGWLCARNSQRSSGFQKWFFKAITPVLVDITYGLVQEINRSSTSQLVVCSTQLCLPFRQRG